MPTMPAMPTKHTRTRIIIAAPPSEVWAALRDFAGYSRWNPALRLRPWGDGALREGQRAWLSLTLHRLPLRVPIVIESADGQRLSWVGGPPGFFRGRHYFELRAVSEGTELTHGEDFTGILLPLMWPMMAGELDRLYRQINEALAAHVTG